MLVCTTCLTPMSRSIAMSVLRDVGLLSMTSARHRAISLWGSLMQAARQ
jgi:hypothetical protein